MAEITAAPHHDDIASSSTASCSASTSYVHYHIFISHCGRDKDAGIFATALCSRLLSRGLHVFLDKLEFVSEEEFTSQIKAAISLASVRIVIFSPNYAEWKWCLDALIHMTNSEGITFPVFYKVKPSEVRWTGKDNDGPYALWMRDHEEKERHDLETIQNWRDVLSRVSNLSGFELEACNGDEEELLRRVVESVFKVCPHPHYNVFLSHRGPDTKEAFALPLYNRLISCGLRVFLDKPELVEGLRIDPQIEVAIQSASVHIAILSPTFVQSPWCLNELFLMTKSEHTTFLPVFYKVKPSDLNGVYVEALFSHQKKQRYDSETIQRWRGALADVPNSNDFMLDGNEEVMDKIKEEVMDKIVQRVLLEYIPKPQENVQSWEGVVNCVLKENDPKPPENVRRAPVEGYYIGLAEKLEDFKKAVLSQQEEERVEAKVVGILGGGGFGKTTLAKQFFEWRSNYNESSFWYDVREHAGRLLLNDLQSPDIGIESVEQGIEMLKQHLPSCNALVILDDVDHLDRLDALLPLIKNVLHPKSLILVTSRDKDVLERAGIVDSSIYRLEGLNEEQSRKLLCHYAFDSRYLLPEFEHLIEEFLRTFDGLPLSLILFGKLLSGKDRCGWENQLNLLHKCILPVEIEHTLKISYDSLNEEEQLIFLDIACFFIGQDRDTALRIWGGEGLKKLENRCLLKVYSNNKIEMNPHLRNYGRMIANRLMPRRLWHQPTNHIDDLLEQSSSELAQCRGITMIPPISNETEMPCSKQSSMFRGPRNLKFLAAEGGYVEDILTRVGSPDLIWLRWYNCTDSYLPPWIPMENLRVLEVDGGKLTELWRPESQVPLRLRELHIFARLSMLPKSIGQLKHLEKIVVECFDDGPLPFIALPKEFCHMRSLKYLQMRRCSLMMSLPDSFGDLTKLEYIDLKGASRLQMLPNSFGNLTLLKHLSLGECSEIEMLPGLEHFTSLETLDVRGCTKLQSIPGLVQLTKLQTLDVSGCNDIQTLPGLEHLSSLKMFNVSGCQKLLSIPELGQPSKLQTLDVSGCTELQKLPGFEHLTSLETFNVSGCQKIQSIPGLGQLTKLQTLDVSGCSDIQQLPGLENLTSLKTFNISGCQKLQSIPGLGKLTNLRTLYVGECRKIQGVEEHLILEVLNTRGCEKLESIRGLGHLTNLQTLDVSECRELQELQGLEHLTSLEALNVSRCEKLESIRLGQLTKLQILDVSGCREILELQGLEHLTSLDKLKVWECEKLQGMPGLGQLTKLKKLEVSYCCAILELGMERLTSLDKLKVWECEKLQGMPGLGQLTKLKKLEVSYCCAILELGMERLTSLEKLKVCGCEKLQGMTGLGQLTKLQILDVSECREILELQGLEHLTSLEKLNVRGCEKLESIPGLGQLTKLQILAVSGWCKIRELQGLEHLTSLEMLKVWGCEKLQGMTGLGQLTKLRTLDVWKCDEILELPGMEHLTSLETLEVCRCHKLQGMPGLGQLTKLKILEVHDCYETLELQGLEHLTSLETLKVCGCEKLQGMPGLGQLTKLKILEVSQCDEILELQGLEHLTSLDKLKVRGCEKLQGMTGLGQLTKLRTLDVWTCDEILELPGIEHLTSLETLEVNGCKKLQGMPSLGQLTKLKILEVIDCDELRELQGLEHLTSLDELRIWRCEKLERIKDLKCVGLQLNKLRTLNVLKCKEGWQSFN